MQAIFFTSLTASDYSALVANRQFLCRHQKGNYWQFQDRGAFVSSGAPFKPLSFRKIINLGHNLKNDLTTGTIKVGLESMLTSHQSHLSNLPFICRIWSLFMECLGNWWDGHSFVTVEANAQALMAELKSVPEVSPAVNARQTTPQVTVQAITPKKFSYQMAAASRVIPPVNAIPIQNVAASTDNLGSRRRFGGKNGLEAYKAEQSNDREKNALFMNIVSIGDYRSTHHSPSSLAYLLQTGSSTQTIDFSSEYSARVIRDAMIFCPANTVEQIIDSLKNQESLPNPSLKAVLEGFIQRKLKEKPISFSAALTFLLWIKRTDQRDLTPIFDDCSNLLKYLFSDNPPNDDRLVECGQWLLQSEHFKQEHAASWLEIFAQRRATTGYDQTYIIENQVNSRFS